MQHIARVFSFVVFAIVVVRNGNAEIVDDVIYHIVLCDNAKAVVGVEKSSVFIETDTDVDAVVELVMNLADCP